MAKKRTSTPAPRRNLKYGNRTGTIAAPNTPVTGHAASSLDSRRASLVTSDGRDFSYVRRDLIGILIIGGSLLILELILAYLFGHTGLGPAVDQAIKL